MSKKYPFLNRVASLPRWVSVVAAVAVYMFFRNVLPLVEFHNPVFKGFALSLSLLAVPLACLFLLAALVSVVRGWKRKQLFIDQKNINDVRRLSWQEFEQYIGEFYRNQGYQVEEKGQGGSDGGIDLIAKKEGNTLLVQCKHWQSRKVGVSVVRELFGVVTAEKAAGGVLITTGSFTQDAQQFAHRQNIRLIDGEALSEMIPIDEVVPRASSKEAKGPVPQCPKCRSIMVNRTAKKGSHRGEDFWGCSRYPACRGTLEK
ncbi:restriction endonuclease [Sansalvadorimonas sp. 2012CJ34-2]|uniref:Restriction endonuclease n=1 Tax=Parendozoicomonas callyspongiae TaxID=2942213 RepID=A0ABT0PLF6_9GAMM|nr:restriction endonuclease [Sansalvadorimonas sp. 2012CJ34-2]MCL6272215.1 restriction endonuclease [Sansalvadorimonas sp. 2012CJ34-2]